MANTSSASVSSSSVQHFVCSVCLFSKTESSVMIESLPVCQECVKDTIIPKFYAAVKFEINYPVTWSGDKSLQPQDFECFFENYPGFLSEWKEKEREYNIVGKDRVYCQGCGAFVGDKTTLTGISQCSTCKERVCSRCGSQEPGKPHQCRKDETKDETENLVGCKRCPRCLCAVELRDGCNDIKCICGAHWCFVCKALSPEHNHWSRGQPCPRFGLPGAENALFNEDAFGGLGPEEFEDFDRLFEEVVRGQVRILSLVLPSTGVNMPGHTLTEDEIGDLRRSQLRIMTGQRNALQTTLGLISRLREDGVGPDEAHFPDALQQAISDLATNVNMYVYYGPIQRAHAEYSRRHAAILRTFREATQERPTRELFARRPMVSLAFSVYVRVAEARLAAAAPPPEA